MRIDLCCEVGLMRIDLVDLLSELWPGAKVAEHDDVGELSPPAGELRGDLVVLMGRLATAADAPNLAAMAEAGAAIVAIGGRDEMSLAAARGWAGVEVPFTDQDLEEAVSAALDRAAAAARPAFAAAERAPRPPSRRPRG